MTRVAKFKMKPIRFIYDYSNIVRYIPFLALNQNRKLSFLKTGFVLKEDIDRETKTPTAIQLRQPAEIGRLISKRQVKEIPHRVYLSDVTVTIS